MPWRSHDQASPTLVNTRRQVPPATVRLRMPRRHAMSPALSRPANTLTAVTIARRAISDTSIVAPLRALQNFIPILVLAASLEVMAVRMASQLRGEAVAGRGTRARCSSCCWRARRRLPARRPPTPSRLFGFKFFGSKDEDEDIVDPLRYTVTLTVDGDDERSQGDAGQGLGAGQRRGTPGFRLARPAGQGAPRPRAAGRGTLCRGPLRRRRRHRHRRAQRSTTCRPTPISGPGPVPVTITIDPGPVFTLGDITLKGDAARAGAGRVRAASGRRCRFDARS